MLRTAWTTACVSAIVLAISPSVRGHLYLMEPVSRNFFYTTTFQSNDFEGLTSCPHCMQSRGPGAVASRAAEMTPEDVLSDNGGGAWPHLTAYNRGDLASNGNFLESDEISVRHGVCGDPEQTSAEGTNVFGRENSIYPVLETYQEGSIIEMKVAVDTYHWGHLEYFICNSEDLSDPEGGPVTQGCFNMHPLDRAEDDGDASPIDPDHPGRYYVDPPCREQETDQTMPDGAYGGYVVTARHKLPEGLTCTRCIIQMVYYTGHICKLPGYEQFEPDSTPEGCAPSVSDWVNLDPPACGEGGAYPEEFWNCADIEIISGESHISVGVVSAPFEEQEEQEEEQEGQGDDEEGQTAEVVADEEEEEEEKEEEEKEEEEKEADLGEEEAGQTEEVVLASNVAASMTTEESNPAKNIIDGSLDTHWAAKGSASWLAIDLPAAVSLSGVELAFEDGDERTQDFEIMVVTQEKVYTTFHTSSGESNDFQRFSFGVAGAEEDEEGAGDLLLVTTVVVVGHGNSVNDWNSFVEIKLCEGGASSVSR
ncbi:unnamed protein product [Scytosiphon promiscuus]